VTGTPCEGGPTISSVVIKLKKNGKLTVKGTGFVAGITVSLNGANLPTPKIKKQGTTLAFKGPLQDGRPFSAVVSSGQQYTLLFILPSGGCSTFTGTAP
jgi:hypothetical protein